MLQGSGKVEPARSEGSWMQADRPKVIFSAEKIRRALAN
jgi:hypothetical protein